MSEDSGSANVLINRNNLNHLFHILIQVHLRGQLSADEQSFVGKFVELPQIPAQPNRKARRTQKKIVDKIIREEIAKQITKK